MDSIDIAAASAVDGWMELGEAHIDGRFGDGFAQANPALLGAFITACAAVARNTLIDEAVCAELEGLRKAVGDVASAIAGHE